MIAELPMFPLGSVLLPSVALPLHVFEPRYKELVRRCLEADPPEFGVVLIERGSEVGGRDVRTNVGTAARILEVAELPDGRYLLGTVGTHRIRVRQWLDDDPFPRAEIEEWPDPDPLVDLEPVYQERVRLLRKALALKSELGEPSVAATVEVSEDAALGSYQLAALAPLGPHDQQRLLAADGTQTRLDLLGRLLDDEVVYLSGRLGSGDG